MICHDSWMLHVWLGVHAWNQPYYRTCMFCYNWWKLHFFWICCVVLLHGNHSLPLISRIKEEIELHGLQSTVSVSPCSHLGGHKYAGNFIIFGSKINGALFFFFLFFFKSIGMDMLLQRMYPHCLSNMFWKEKL